MKESQQPLDQFYEEQFAKSKLVPYGNQGRVLFGLIRLEEHAANMAAAWLQGGWRDDELAEMLTTGLLETVIECAEYIQRYRVAENGEAFSETWENFVAAANHLRSASDPNAIKPILLLLPITAFILRSSFSSLLGLVPQGTSVVAPESFKAIKIKSEELGCDVSIESVSSDTLVTVAAALKSYAYHPVGAA